MNDHNGNLEKRIGISTISLANITLSEAIDNILGAGFKAIEVFMGLGDYAAIGWPRTAPGPGLHPDACCAAERKVIREKLKSFDHITAHVQIFGVNIASPNAGIRKESIRQNLACVDLAHELGINLITFHPGRAGVLVYPVSSFRQEGDQFNCEFFERAIEKVEKYDMQTGVEGPDGAGWPTDNILKRITHERFGHLVDPTQGFYGMRFDVDKLLDSIAKSRGRIVEVHMHGGRYRTWGGHAPHVALSMHNEFDYPLVIEKINETGFNGTFMFEITAAEDFAENIEHCRRSKEMLIQFHES